MQTSEKFWVVERDGNQKIKNIIIDELRLIEFLNGSGYLKYYVGSNLQSILIYNNGGIIEECSTSKIQDYLLKTAKDQSIWQLESTEKRLLEAELIHKRSSLFTHKYFSNLRVMKKPMIKDGVDYSLIPFKNGILKIEKDIIQLLDYNDYHFNIWKDQVIDKNFEFNEGESDFEKFAKNISGTNDKRFESLQSAIGYLVYSFKNSSIQKAIVFSDEVINIYGEPEGRTGKTLIGKAISQVRNIAEFDGKSFSTKAGFAFQKVTPSTQILFFNDVVHNFNIEQLFTVISDGIEINKKFKDPITIPYQDSPKVLITTNYSVLGRSASYRDRMFEIALVPYYSDTHKPIDDFGKPFFSNEWDSKDWNKFYSFIVRSVQLFLKKGLLSFENEMIQKKKNLQEFGVELYEYFNIIKPRINYYKKDLYDGFRNYTENRIQIPQITFTKRLQQYAESKGWEIETHESNGKSFIEFKER